MRASTAFMFVLISTSVLFAQNSGAISGVVFDGLGAPLPAAEIEAKSAASGTVYRATSSAKGEYTVAGLPPGAYEFAVIVHGGRQFVEQNAVVEAGKALRIEARLKDTNLGTLGDDVFAAAALDRRPTAAGPAPRTLDGKPDFAGVWSPSRAVEVGKSEMLPWAEAEVKREGRAIENPTARCLPWGPLLDGPFPFKFVQSPSVIVVLIEDIFSYRQIFLDGRGHPKDGDPTWMGHSIGRWEGDTLVVDSAGFNNKSWTPMGRPHTDQLHIIERFRRIDAGHLDYEMTIDDPGTYVKPWTIKRASNLLVGDEIGEYICTENNQDVQHMIAK
jgi:carboxypeptidase family protein